MEITLLPIALILLAYGLLLAVLAVVWRHDDNAPDRWPYVLVILFSFVGSLIGLALLLLPLGVVGALAWGALLFGLSFANRIPDDVWRHSQAFRLRRDLGHYQRVLHDIHELRQAWPWHESHQRLFKVDDLAYELFMCGGERYPRIFVLFGGSPPRSWRIGHKGLVYLLDQDGRLAIRLAIANASLEWMIELVPDGRCPESFTIKFGDQENTVWRYELQNASDLGSGYFLTTYETIDPLDGSQYSPPPGYSYYPAGVT